MRVLLQRVRSASVSVGDGEVARIGAGLLAFVGFTDGDDATRVAYLAEKTARLRVFADERGRFQHCITDVGGSVLAVPQFTLYADTGRGRRPDFTRALAPERASALFDVFLHALTQAGIERVDSGVFGANMAVTLVNDGPVTLLLER